MRALGYRRYRVYGTSGGGPYALGIAALAHEGQVLACGVMAGSAPKEASRRNYPLRHYWWYLVTWIAPSWRAFWMSRIPIIQRFARFKAFQATTFKERELLAIRETYIGDGVKGFIQDHNTQNQA